MTRPTTSTSTSTEEMENGMSTLTPADRVARATARYHALYTPSVLERAGALLEALEETAAAHDVRPGSDAAGWLLNTAVEAISGWYGRPRPERDPQECYRLLRELADACTAAGLTVTPGPARMGTTVGPLREGGRSFTVSLFIDDTWSLTPGTTGGGPSLRIHGPVTTAGAAEIAELLRAIAAGDAPDPFAQR